MRLCWTDRHIRDTQGHPGGAAIKRWEARERPPVAGSGQNSRLARACSIAKKLAVLLSAPPSIFPPKWRALIVKVLAVGALPNQHSRPQTIEWVWKHDMFCGEHPQQKEVFVAIFATVGGWSLSPGFSPCLL